MGTPPKYDSKSEFQSITYIEGLRTQRSYYIGQYLSAEQSNVYSINDTSEITEAKTFIRRFTIHLINKDGVVTEWRNYEKGEKDSVSYVRNREELLEI